MASPELREVIRGLQALRGIAQISAVWLFVKGSHSEPFGFAQGKLRDRSEESRESSPRGRRRHTLDSSVAPPRRAGAATLE